MISELGRRHVARINASLMEYERGAISLHGLINSLEALIGLLLEEGAHLWIEELEAETNELEFINSAGIIGRTLTPKELEETQSTVARLRLLIEPYM